MRITKSKYSHAIVTLSRDSNLTSRLTSDGPDVYEEQQLIHRKARAFCAKHNLFGYSVYASMARGGSLVDEVDL